MKMKEKSTSTFRLDGNAAAGGTSVCSLPESKEMFPSAAAGYEYPIFSRIHLHHHLELSYTVRT